MALLQENPYTSNQGEPPTGWAARACMADTIFTVPSSLQHEYQRLLSETAHLLLRDGESDELCQTIFSILRSPLQLAVYFHYLVNEEGSGLILASSGGSEEVRAALGTPLAFGEAVCGTVAQRCEWMHVTNVQERNDRMTALIRSYGIRAYSCQPLMSNGRMMGTLSFGSKDCDAFTADQLEVLRIVAEQVTVSTERRIQSRYVRQLEQQASAGRMCATIAHEINNPLEALGNILYLFRDEALSDEGSKRLAIAEREVARLAQTTQRTLDLFRGKAAIPQRVEVGSLLGETIAALLPPKRAIMEADIDPDLHVKGVPGELRQVFFNLLLNAAQFSPSGTKVQLLARRSGGSVLVQIRDEGPGISEQMRRRMFQPFQTTRGDSGTGLGLWVSHEIISRSGGSLTFESDPARRPGTTFVVSLPYAMA